MVTTPGWLNFEGGSRDPALCTAVEPPPPDPDPDPDPDPGGPVQVFRLFIGFESMPLIECLGIPECADNWAVQMFGASIILVEYKIYEDEVQIESGGQNPPRITGVTALDLGNGYVGDFELFIDGVCGTPETCTVFNMPRTMHINLDGPTGPISVDLDHSQWINTAPSHNFHTYLVYQEEL